MEIELKHLEENFSFAVLRIFGINFYPGPALAALRQIFAIRRNLGHYHLDFRWPGLMTGVTLPCVFGWHDPFSPVLPVRRLIHGVALKAGTLPDSHS